MPGPILIVGGGIAGLSLGIALSKYGIACKILEREAEFTAAGAGIQLGPNATCVLEALGVSAHLRPLAGTPDAIAVADGASGRELTRLPLGRWIETRHGAPYWVLHRKDLQSALVEAARTQAGLTIVNGADIVSVEENGTEVRVFDQRGGEFKGSLLIGADGVWSSVRRSVHAATPQFSGRTAARAVITRADAPAMFQKNVTRVYLAPDAHVVVYPVDAGAALAVVAIAKETWRDATWSAPVSADEIAKRFASFAPDVQGLLPIAQDWRKWPLFAASEKYPWSRGRVGLIGDAAHPILPFLAQGAAMALEDAVVLAHCLAIEPGSPSAALASFESQRKIRVTRVAQMSWRNGQIYHLSGALAAARNMTLRLSKPERLMKNLDWLYGWRPPVL